MATRTFFPSPRAILTIDLLLRYRALPLDDLATVLSSIAKETRQSLNPLRSAKLVATGSRAEIKLGAALNPHATRANQRDYFYIDIRLAVDAIKYRVMKLRRRVEALYSIDEAKRKDWICKRCGAEYEELEVMDKISDDGFYCERCGNTLTLNEAAQQDRGSHEKIRRLNEQLSRFDALIVQIDSALERNPDALPHSDGLFAKLYETKIEIPRPDDRQAPKFITVDAKKGREKTVEEVKAENLQVTLTSGVEHDREEAEKAEQRRKEIARQNVLPVWHTQSAIGMKNEAGDSSAGIKREQASGVGVGVKKEEEDEKKPELVTGNELQDEVAKYIEEMERERLEAEQKAREESEEEEEDEEGDFEDVDGVGTSVVGTPLSSQELDTKPKPEPPTSNGVKRELEIEEESSEAATPVSVEREAKRVKVEEAVEKGRVNGTAAKQIKIEAEPDGDGDSEEDEFEDAM